MYFGYFLPTSLKDNMFWKKNRPHRHVMMRCTFKHFMWVHHSVEGHEEADRLAKQALKHAQIDIKVSMSKTEVKRVNCK